MADVTTDDELVYSSPDDPDEALAELYDLRGQSYYKPDKAFRILLGIRPLLTLEDGYADGTHDWTTALGERIAEVQTLARDSRGTPTVPPYQPILTGAEIAEIAVEMIGGESSDASMLGAGSTADVRAEDNIETVREHIEAGDDE